AALADPLCIVMDRIDGRTLRTPAELHQRGYIGYGMPRITEPEDTGNVRFEFRRVEFRGYQPVKLQDRNRGSTPNAEDPVVGRPVLHRQKVRRNNVVNVHEIAQLPTLLEDGRGNPREIAQRKDPTDPGV